VKNIGNPPKLTAEQARTIRDEFKGYYGEQMKLARQYNVSQTCIRSILRGKSYKRILRVGERVDLTHKGRQFERDVLEVIKDELPNCVWRHADTPFAANH
jgi:hypothetical protein